MTQSETNDTESPVIDAIRGGDRYAFGEWLRRHDGWVRGVIFSVLGRRDGLDDVAQQVWTAAWQRINELRDPSRWRPWLYRLARNASIDAGREATRRKNRHQSLTSVGLSLNTTRSSKMTSDVTEKHEKVLAAIQALPVLYREPFVLRHLSGWSYRQIADAMGMPKDSVETRLVRARRMLRESLKGELE